MNDNAQMMILESVFFAITAIIALTFLIQISPTSIETSDQPNNEYCNYYRRIILGK
jgi:hypothetical protein